VPGAGDQKRAKKRVPGDGIGGGSGQVGRVKKAVEKIRMC
jgi:hypothetical protein